MWEKEKWDDGLVIQGDCGRVGCCMYRNSKCQLGTRNRGNNLVRDRDTRRYRREKSTDVVTR